MGNITELRERVCKANIELKESGLVVHTWGNVSGIDREENLVVIKPSGVAYKELIPEKMVIVSLEDNHVHEGELNPSSDTRSHTILYRNFPKIGGIVHTHSNYATSWAQAKMPIPCYGTTHADYSPCEIPCTNVMRDEQIKRDYEEETGIQIIETFNNDKYNYEHTPMTIIAGHGAFAWGNSPEQAVYHAIVLEEIAKMAFNTILINPEIKTLKRTLIDKHFFRKHGKDAYYGQIKNNK